MKAVRFENKSMSFVDLPLPAPGPGEALLRVRAAGICNTDIELFNGYYGFSGVPGHEFAAVVEQAADRPEFEGCRVVCDINIGCGACEWCAKGQRRHCATRKTLGIAGWDGAFAEYVKAPLSNLYLVPDGMPDQQAVLVEPLAAALEIGQQVHITNETRLLVLGDGKLGLLAALALRMLNPRLLLVGKHRDRLDLARLLGVRTLLIDGSEDFAELARDRGPFDLVVEASGRPETANQALQLLRPEGTLVLKTTSATPAQLDLAKVVVDEIQIVGSRCGDFDLALSYLRNGWIRVDPLVEAVYPFTRFEEAFAHARSGSLKIIVEMEQP
jgi:threonine dehydrogenase-like Zn-dependent dehydrogenase